MLLQGIEPFLTSADIEKGAKWQGEIVAELEHSNYGLVCLTPQNLASQWLAFEAGALSKHLGGRVATLLFNVGHGDVAAPLNMFQGTLFNEEDFRQLVGSINKALPKEMQRTEAQLGRLFEKFWPDLHEAIHLIADNAGVVDDAPAPTKVEIMAQEMMALLKQQNQLLASPETLVEPVLRALARQERLLFMGDPFYPAAASGGVGSAGTGGSGGSVGSAEGGAGGGSGGAGSVPGLPNRRAFGLGSRAGRVRGVLSEALLEEAVQEAIPKKEE